MLARLTVSCLLVAALAACADGDAPSGGAPRELTGVVVGVRSPGLGDVRGFTLRSGDETYEVAIDPDVSYDFALPHLNDHLATAEPVRVEIDERGAKLFAVSIEDA